MLFFNMNTVNEYMNHTTSAQYKTKLLPVIMEADLKSNQLLILPSST